MDCRPCRGPASTVFCCAGRASNRACANFVTSPIRSCGRRDYGISVESPFPRGLTATASAMTRGATWTLSTTSIFGTRFTASRRDIGTRSIATAGLAPMKITFPTAGWGWGPNGFGGVEKIERTTRCGEARTAISSVKTTAHLINNLLVEASEARRAKVLGIVSFYGASVRAPAPQSKPPMLIADLIAECVLDDGNGWQFQSHLLQPVFM